MPTRSHSPAYNLCIKASAPASPLDVAYLNGKMRTQHCPQACLPPMKMHVGQRRTHHPTTCSFELTLWYSSNNVLWCEMSSDTCNILAQVRIQYSHSRDPKSSNRSPSSYLTAVYAAHPCIDVSALYTAKITDLLNYIEQALLYQQ